MLSRDVVSLWVLAGLLAFTVGEGGGRARLLVNDWLPFLGALLVYDLLRGLAGSSPLFEPHVWPQIRADELLFGSLPTVDLQQQLYVAGEAQWYDVAAWAVYLTHFVAAFAIAAVLWRIARPRFQQFRTMLLSLTAAAFATYVLFPAAPPWLASDDGAIGSVDRVVGGVWEVLGVEPAAAIWQRGSAFANEVAAISSLHTAYPVLFLCFFWNSGRWPRGICLTYAVAMSFTLVYTGEHYVADVLLGWLYAIGIYLAVRRVSAALRRRRGEPAPAPAV